MRNVTVQLSLNPELKETQLNLIMKKVTEANYHRSSSSLAFEAKYVHLSGDRSFCTTAGRGGISNLISMEEALKILDEDIEVAKIKDGDYVLLKTFEELSADDGRSLDGKKYAGKIVRVGMLKPAGRGTYFIGYSETENGGIWLYEIKRKAHDSEAKLKELNETAVSKQIEAELLAFIKPGEWLIAKCGGRDYIMRFTKQASSTMWLGNNFCATHRIGFPEDASKTEGGFNKIIRKATDDEIKKHLLGMATKLYPVGTEYLSADSSQRCTRRYELSVYTKDDSYRHRTDTITDGYGGYVYFDGKWAEIAPIKLPMIMVGGIIVETKQHEINIGCTAVSFSSLKEMITAMQVYNLAKLIHADGTVVTLKELIDLRDAITNNKTNYIDYKATEKKAD